LLRGRTTTTTTSSTTTSSTGTEAPAVATENPADVANESENGEVESSEKIETDTADEALVVVDEDKSPSIASLKPGRGGFHRLEMTTEPTSTTTFAPLEVRMNRLKKRPTLNVSQRPKTTTKRISISDRRKNFSALNKKNKAKEDKTEAERVQLLSEEINDSALKETSIELVRETPVASASVVEPSSTTRPAFRFNRNRVLPTRRVRSQ